MRDQHWEPPNYAADQRMVDLGHGVSAMRYRQALTDELVDGWRIEAWVEQTAAGPRFVDLHVMADADHPIDSDALRRLPLRRLMAYVEQHQVIAQGGWSTEGDADRKAYLRARRRQEKAKGQWRRLTDDDLARTARAYRAAVKAGEPPTAAVAQELGLTRGQAARWVKRAREEGHLGPALGHGQQGEIRPRDNSKET